MQKIKRELLCDSYSDLREEVRKNLKINRVQQGRIQNKIQISKDELDNFLQTEEAQNQLGPELRVRQILIRKNSSQNVFVLNTTFFESSPNFLSRRLNATVSP